jgi:hypothetical protein
MRALREPSALRAEAAEALVEAGKLAAGVEQALLPTGPRRMRFRINVEAQRVAFLAVGRAPLVLGAICHLDGDLVVVGVDFVFHRATLLAAARYIAPLPRICNQPSEIR